MWTTSTSLMHHVSKAQRRMSAGLQVDTEAQRPAVPIKHVCCGLFNTLWTVLNSPLRDSGRKRAETVCVLC